MKVRLYSETYINDDGVETCQIVTLSDISIGEVVNTVANNGDWYVDDEFAFKVSCIRKVTEVKHETSLVPKKPKFLPSTVRRSGHG